MMRVVLPSALLGTQVSVAAEDIVDIRWLPIGPKLFLRDGRTLVTTAKAVSWLQTVGFIPRTKAP
jgi:hypothetical protein